MLRFLPLVWANSRRHRLRLLFTLASIVIAFLLFGLLEAMRYAFTAGVDLAGADRLMVLHKVSIIQPLPASYGNRIRGVAGIKQLTAAVWFGGVYQDDRNQIPVFPVEAEAIEIYPEIVIPDSQRRAWLGNRRGALVGRAFADQFGWDVGDTIPMRSNIWRRADGGDTWELQVEGIFDARDGRGDTRNVLMHYDYFNEGRSEEGGRDLVGWYILKVDDPANAPRIAPAVDAMFANSPFETRTSSEKAIAQQFANQIGNIGAILIAVVTAVFFTMLLVTANTMSQSVRERTGELAVLKTLGFTSTKVMALVLLEAIAITVAGGLTGLLLALALIGVVGSIVQQYLPVFALPPQSIVIALALMLGVGLLAGALPGAQALRLRIVDALRRT